MKKKPWLSKTLWGNLVMAALALVVPGVSTWLQANPQVMVIAFAGANALLRLITKDKLSLN